MRSLCEISFNISTNHIHNGGIHFCNAWCLQGGIFWTRDFLINDCIIDKILVTLVTNILIDMHYCSSCNSLNLLNIILETSCVTARGVPPLPPTSCLRVHFWCTSRLTSSAKKSPQKPFFWKKFLKFFAKKFPGVGGTPICKGTTPIPPSPHPHLWTWDKGTTSPHQTWHQTWHQTGTPPPPLTDRNTENITFPHSSVGGKNSIK